MKKRLRALFFPLAFIAVIFFLSGTNPKLPKEISFVGIDKVIHFFVFGIMAVAWARVRIGKTLLQQMIVAVLIVSLYGAADEYHQSFTPGRSVDFYDWIADTSGAVVFCAVYYQCVLLRKILESSRPVRTVKAFIRLKNTGKH